MLLCGSLMILNVYRSKKELNTTADKALKNCTDFSEPSRKFKFSLL